MGNSLGGSKSAKVTKINGETFKLKAPARARSVLESYPGLVLLESEAVKHFGVRAKPLEPQQELKPKRLYFLVELPKYPQDRSARRVRSGIQMSAKDRLESLMLARRSASDLSVMKPALEEVGGGVRVRMRLPKAEVERLMAETGDRAVVGEKIVSLYMSKSSAAVNGDHGMVKSGMKSREKPLGFIASSEERSTSSYPEII